jgi:hypothetical protein
VAIIAFPLADYRPIQEFALSGESVAVLSRTTRQTTPAVVDLKWSAPREITVGDGAGRITEVYVTAGQQLTCGAPVVAIDGAARLAMCGAVPPWREVTSRTQGRDADQLADLLVGLGLLSEADRSNGARRAAAWRELARYVGLPASNVFQPSDVVWIGDATSPSEVSVQVGDRIAADDTLFVVDAVLQSAAVEAPIGDGPAVSDWVFSVDGSTVEFPILADGLLNHTEFEAVARSTITEPDGALPTRLQGFRRLASPTSRAAIPPSALVTAPDGSTCVLLAEGGTIPVTVVESVTGLVLIDANLAEGTAIRDLPAAGTAC